MAKMFSNKLASFGNKNILILGTQGFETAIVARFALAVS
jgi:hypothetical protein